MPSIDQMKLVLYVGILASVLFVVGGIIANDSEAIAVGAVVATASVITLGGQAVIRSQKMNEDILYQSEEDEE